jgi:hypothetical protein
VGQFAADGVLSLISELPEFMVRLWLDEYILINVRSVIEVLLELSALCSTDARGGSMCARPSFDTSSSSDSNSPRDNLSLSGVRPSCTTSVLTVSYALMSLNANDAGLVMTLYPWP